MFFFLNKNKILQMVVCLLLFAWSVFTIFTQMTLNPMDGQTLFFQSFHNYFATHLLGLRILTVMMLLVSLFFAHRYYEVSKLSENHTFIPILFFLLFVNAGHVLTSFTPSYFTMLLLLFVLGSRPREDNNRTSNSRIFSSGMLIGIATMLDPSAIWLMLFLLMVLLSNQFTKFKQLFIPIIGFLIVVIYLFSVAYLLELTPSVLQSIKYLSTFSFLKGITDFPVVKLVAYGYILLALLYVATVDKIYFDNKLVVLRKRFRNNHFLFFTALLMMFFSGLTARESMLYLLPPVTVYLSVLCMNKRRKLIHDLMIIAFFIALWL